MEHKNDCGSNCAPCKASTQEDLYNTVLSNIDECRYIGGNNARCIFSTDAPSFTPINSAEEPVETTPVLKFTSNTNNKFQHHFTPQAKSNVPIWKGSMFCKCYMEEYCSPNGPMGAGNIQPLVGQEIKVNQNWMVSYCKNQFQTKLTEEMQGRNIVQTVQNATTCNDNLEVVLPTNTTGGNVNEPPYDTEIIQKLDTNNQIVEAMARGRRRAADGVGMKYLANEMAPGQFGGPNGTGQSNAAALCTTACQCVGVCLGNFHRAKRVVDYLKGHNFFPFVGGPSLNNVIDNFEQLSTVRSHQGGAVANNKFFNDLFTLVDGGGGGGGGLDLYAFFNILYQNCKIENGTSVYTTYQDIILRELGIDFSNPEWRSWVAVFFHKFSAYCAMHGGNPNGLQLGNSGVSARWNYQVTIMGNKDAADSPLAIYYKPVTLGELLTSPSFQWTFNGHDYHVSNPLAEQRAVRDLPSQLILIKIILSACAQSSTISYENSMKTGGRGKYGADCNLYMGNLTTAIQQQQQGGTNYITVINQAPTQQRSFEQTSASSALTGVMDTLKNGKDAFVPNSPSHFANTPLLQKKLSYKKGKEIWRFGFTDDSFCGWKNMSYI